METFKITEDITWIGTLDPNLRIFDIIMYTEYGTTYNAYVLKGSEKTALIDTAKGKFLESYIEKLTSVVAIEDIDLVIIHHTEPDHSGSLRYLIEINPNIQVVGSPSSIKFLADILNCPFHGHALKENETISLGNKTLRFMMAPQLHWPDAMYTYVQEDQILFSCDSFGSHFSFDHVMSSQLKDQKEYLNAVKGYFDDIMSPFKPFVLKAMSKLESLDIRMILTGHGPSIDQNPKEFIEMYQRWATESNFNKKKQVVIPYVSAYGYTELMGKTIKTAIEQAADIEVTLYDLVKEDQQTVIEKMLEADGVLFGTPTILSDALKPIWDLVAYMNPVLYRNKHASAFGSYGWTGEAVDNITQRLQQLKMKVMPGLSIKFNPDSEEKLAKCEAFGVAFANQMMK